MKKFPVIKNPSTFLLLLPFIVYFCAAALTFTAVEEDAFIYFRIAQNMADGYGIVFNRGGEHIESGSGLVWQLLLAMLAGLPVHLVIATKFLGVLFACLSLWMLLRLSHRFINDERLAVFPALCLAASTPFYYWSHRGLETPLFVFMLLWLVDWLTDRKKIHLWFVPAFLVFCSRPEGFLMVAAAVPWLWLERKNITGFLQGAIVFILLVLVVENWRLLYFHDLLPHAFYQKIGGDYGKSFVDLLRYSLWNGIFLLLLVALPAMLEKTHWHRSLVPVVLVIAITAVWGVIGADWKSFNRQLASWLPFVFLLLFYFISQFRLLGFPKWKNTATIIASGYVACLFVFSPYTTSRGEILLAPVNSCLRVFSTDPATYVENVFHATINPEGYFTQTEPTLAGDHIGFNRNATVGRFIRQNYPEHITVIFDQMGQAPWYGGLDKTFIDNTGLTDKMIAYYMFHNKAQDNALFSLYERMLVSIKQRFWPEERYYYSKAEIIDRLFKARPELVLMRERYVDREENSIIATFAQDARFADYREVYRLNNRDIVFQRRDLPVNLQPVVPPGALVEIRYRDGV